MWAAIWNKRKYNDRHRMYTCITLRRICELTVVHDIIWWWWRITINEEVLHPGLTITISTWHIFENNTYNRKARQTYRVQNYLVYKYNMRTIWETKFSYSNICFVCKTDTSIMKCNLKLTGKVKSILIYLLLAK